jgi:hypothetical protein
VVANFDALPGTYVVQCSSCKTILGDTSNYLCSIQNDKYIVLKGNVRRADCRLFIRFGEKIHTLTFIVNVGGWVGVRGKLGQYTTDLLILKN